MRHAYPSILALLTLAACSNGDKVVGTGTSVGANNAPTIGSVALTPDPGFELTVLNCQATGLDDPDGDVVTLTYVWQVNGTEIAATSATLNGDDFSKNDAVSCTATPDDGFTQGVPLTSNIVTILNTPPAGTSVAVGPDPANSLDTLTATPTGWTDADGDAESWNYAWFVNGIDVGAATNELSNSFQKGDDVWAIATPNDLDDLGDPLQSNTVTIANTPPSLVDAAITPANPFAGDVLVCSPSGETDLDGDAVTFIFEWFVNGNPAGSGTDILVAPSFTRGDDVYCVVTPTDGQDEGTPVQSAPVSIFNAVPTIDSATLGPEPAYKDTVLVCSGNGIVDTDGDTPVLTFSWTVGGVPVPAAGPSLDGNSFSRDDAVQCTIVVSDGLDNSAPAISNLVFIQNTAPSATSVAIAPVSPYTDDATSAVVVGWNDLDGDLEGYQYAWFVNSTELIGETASTLSPANYVKNDVIAVRVTPDDGTDTGPPLLSSDVVVRNSPPTLAGASVGPAAPAATDTLTCNQGGANDADGDGITYTYQWVVNGSPVGTGGNQLNAPDFSSGDNVFCVVTPNDGDENGTPVQSAPVSIANTAPTIDSATVAPDPAYEDDILTCTPNNPTDLDGDALTLTYAWVVAGIPIAATTSTIDGADFNKDQAVQCSVMANDGSSNSAPAISNTVLILNSAPSAASAVVVPAAPSTTTDVNVIMSGWVDIDGDLENYLFQWAVNGTALLAETGTSLASINYSKGNVLTVTATPDDGTDFGTPIVSADVIVVNTPPTLVSATINPAAPNASDTLTCTGAGEADDDNDAVSFNYEWFVNGGSAGVGATFPAPASGDTAYCVITPFDGEDNGAPVTSSPVSVNNSTPTIASVILAPDPAYENTTLNCMESGVLDLDGDPVTVTYTWTVGGLPILPVTPSLDGTYFNKGQAVQCFATAADAGSNSGPIGSNLVVIGNTAPSFTTVVIAPLDPQTNDDVSVSASGWNDIDGDTPSYQYQWFVDGASILGATSSTLLSTNYAKGQFITVQATPFDGTDTGGSLISAAVEVLNTPPTTPAVSVTPNPADQAESLFCSIDTASTDADNDGISYIYSWTVNSAPTAEVTNTVSSLTTVKGDVWQCSVQADDGQDLSGVASATTVVTDTVAPNAPLLDTLPTYANDNVYTVTGTSENDAIVTLVATCDMGSSGQQVTNADPTGNFTFTFVAAFGETCTFVVTAEDIDGNISPDSNQVNTMICPVPDVYEDGVYGNTQATAIDEWFPLIDDGTGTYLLEGNILDTDPGDWFVVYGTDDAIADNVAGNNEYDFRIQITDTSGQYTFLVNKGSLGFTTLECSAQAVLGYDDYNDYYFDSGDALNHTPAVISTNCRNNVSTLNDCQDMSKAYFVEVIRDPAFAFDCTNYQITVTNNAP